MARVVQPAVASGQVSGLGDLVIEVAAVGEYEVGDIVGELFNAEPKNHAVLRAMLPVEGVSLIADVGRRGTMNDVDRPGRASLERAPVVAVVVSDEDHRRNP